MKRAIALAALISVFCITGTAHAQVNDQAFSHFEAGAKLYGSKDYRGAITEFRQSYEIQAHPMFQVNIALAHWRLDELLDAISAADLAAVEAEQLGPEVASENAARRASFSTLRVGRERANTIAADLAAQNETLEIVDVSTSDSAAPASGSGLSGLGWTGIATAGVGGVLLIGWSVAEVGLADDLQRYERAGEAGDRALYDELGQEFQRKQTTARILLGSGAALTAIGAGLLIFDLVAGRSDDTAVSVRVSPQPSVVFEHRF